MDKVEGSCRNPQLLQELREQLQELGLHTCSSSDYRTDHVPLEQREEHLVKVLPLYIQVQGQFSLFIPIICCLSIDKVDSILKSYQQLTVYKFNTLQYALFHLKLVLNTDKTKYTVFSRAKEIDSSLQICSLNGTPVEKVPHYKYFFGMMTNFLLKIILITCVRN